MKVKGTESYHFTALDESKDRESIPHTLKWPVWEKGKVKGLGRDWSNTYNKHTFPYFSLGIAVRLV